MHLLESFAVSAGCLIDKCFIQEEEIQLPQKPYITFHGFNAKGSTRQYSYWQNVIDNLIEDSDFNYKIIQIGEGSAIRYGGINTNYLGKTNYNSLAYLIKNAELHFGFDSLPVHIASHYNKKIVAIYAHYAANTGPYFSKKEDVFLFEPNDNFKPVFAEDDYLHRINNINPLAISSAIIKLLKI